MILRTLPPRPSLEQYKNQAKDLLNRFKNLPAQPRPFDFGIVALFRELIPRFHALTDAEVLKSRVLLADTQFILARQHGFASWAKFAKHIAESRRDRSADPIDAFIEAASVPVGDWHVSGTLDAAQAILLEHPEVSAANIYTAAILGDDSAVRRFLALDARCATAKGGPHHWDALTYLCFSRYLRLDRTRSAGFVRAAEALLDAGASIHSGWYDNSIQPEPEWESLIYGVAGLAQHPEMTRLLLARGADPNDSETPYHAPETYDNATMEVLVESGKLTSESLTTLLLRKTDWHDYDGIKYLLEHGADPSRMTRWQNGALHHALRRDNDLPILNLMLDYSADVDLVSGRDGRSATQIAARRGRGDFLDQLDRRGISIRIAGVDRLIAACARNDAEAIREIAASEPELVRDLRAEGGRLLAEFAGRGNTEGVRQLLDLGVDPATLYREGDGYFEITKDSTALHVAAWRARHDTVRLLIERGAPVDAPDKRGRTPLALAVRACVDSYWTNRRSPDSVRLLLEAGASTNGIVYPSGYDEVDALLQQYRQ